MEDGDAIVTVGATEFTFEKDKAKVERARLKRVRDREAAKPAKKMRGAPTRDHAKKTKPKHRTPQPKRLKSAARGVVMRSERLDMRVTKAEKARVRAKAKKVKRTITSVVLEAIEKIK